MTGFNSPRVKAARENKTSELGEKLRETIKEKQREHIERVNAKNRLELTKEIRGIIEPQWMEEYRMKAETELRENKAAPSKTATEIRVELRDELGREPTVQEVITEIQNKTNTAAAPGKFGLRTINHKALARSMGVFTAKEYSEHCPLTLRAVNHALYKLYKEGFLDRSESRQNHGRYGTEPHYYWVKDLMPDA